MLDLTGQVSSLQQAAAPESQFSNKHFQAPTASPFFTGREALLNQVEHAFGLVSYPSANFAAETSKSLDNLVPSSPPLIASDAVAPSHHPSFGQGKTQKRYIIYGLGGSGKTEFCRKFAERNQRR